MRELTSFHAAQRGLSASTYGGDCGCGCNNCGEYAGAEWLPGGFPNWNYESWGRDKWLGGGCPKYEKLVEEYEDLLSKYEAIPLSKWALAGSPLGVGFFRGGYKKDQPKADRLIAKAKTVKSKGKAAASECKRLQKKGEGKYDETTAAIEAGRGAGAAPAASAGDEEFKAALEKVAQSGGGGSASEGGGLDTKTLLIIGGVAVLGLGALFVLRKPAAPKKKAAAPAAAPVAAPAVVA
jgi:hypothetical protein